MRHEGKVYHYRVNKTPTGVSITKERSFPTLKDLVKFHSKNADGLIHALKVGGRGQIENVRAYVLTVI